MGLLDQPQALEIKDKRRLSESTKQKKSQSFIKNNDVRISNETLEDEDLDERSIF